MPTSDAPGEASLRQDPLTGLGTLLAFLARLNAALDPALPATLPLAVVIIDLGDDRPARDQPPIGDEAILRVAVALWGLVTQRQPHAGGAAFRLGDTEFALLLPGTDGAEAERVAAELLTHEALSRLPLNIGISVAAPDGPQFGQVLLNARGALRDAREQGGRRAVLQQQAQPDPLGAGDLIQRLAEQVIAMGGRLEEACHLAFVDPASGLPNQQVLNRFLQSEIPRAVRYRRDLTLLLVDGDNLKDFNTRFGYAAGDRWIKSLGQVLVKATRASDLVVRWRMGDEFVIALPETGVEAATLLAGRIRTAVEELAPQLPLPVTVSIGVATFPDDAETADKLLLAAEAANQRAKAAGKNRIAFATHLDKLDKAVE